MADVKSDLNPLFLREADLNRGMELLFYAYRAFTAEPDAILAELDFGRAHHRALYFIGRNPDISVAELLEILRVTNQSLSRVLGQLVAHGFVAQRKGDRDRRQRLLRLTGEGAELEGRLASVQRRRIARAYRNAGVEAVEGYVTVMTGLMDEDDRRRYERGES